MTKMPPPDDEQEKYLPHQRRKRTAAPRPFQRAYRSDELPEIPRVRRASLHLNKQEAPPLPNEEEPIEEGEHAHEPGRATYRHSSQKIMLARRRQAPIYEPPPPAHRARRGRSQASLPVQLRNLTHNPAFVIIATFLLAVLVITSIAAYAIRSQTSVTASTPASGQLPSSLHPAANPHEILIAPQDTDHPAPPVYATAAYLLDADTGATLYAHNPFMHLPELSTTKLMTAVLAVEHGNIDQRVTITPAIAHDISQLSADSSLFAVKKGEMYSLRDLLYALILVSSNDAAVAIADGIAGDIPHFVAEMNQRAQQLGLHDTHYMNPHGLLQTGHYSSAHDLAMLGRYSMSLPVVHQVSGTMQYHIPKTRDHAERFLINENQFLWWYPGADGGKTGQAPNVYVQVVSCVRNHRHLIGVTIHTIDWWTDMRDLMNWGFDSFKWISPYDVDFQHPIPYDYLWNYFSGDKKENTIPTADKGRYYIYTGYSISSLILAYFDKNGNLKKFGYPESMPVISRALVASQKFDHGTIQCNLTTKHCTTG
jgi:D-alanyl-D-alanine carboxypeptidase